MQIFKSLTSHIINAVRKNLKYKMFLILSVVISILVLLFSLISYFSTANIIYRDYVNYKLLSNQQTMKSLDNNMDYLIQQTYQIYNHYKAAVILLTQDTSSPSYFGAYTDTKNAVSSIVSSSSNIYALTLTDLKGNVIVYADKSNYAISQENISGYPAFEEIFDLNGRYTILPPHESYFSRRFAPTPKVISIAATLVNLGTDTPIGTIMVDQTLPFFDELIANATPEPDEHLLFLDKNNDVIYSNRPADGELYQQIIPSLLNKNESASSTIVYTTDNIPFLVTYSPPSSFGWRVVSIIPNDEIIGKSDYVRNINFTLLIIIIAASLVLSILISSRISSPLQKLRKGFSQLEKGEFGVQLNVVGQDEMARITSAFNHMSTRMEHMINEQYLSEINLQRAQLESMQSQINPHFLYNTLNIMKAHADMNGSLNVSKMIQSLASVFRYSLSRGKDTVKMSDEIEHLRKYLYLQNVRFDPAAVIIWNIDERTLECDVLRFTLQPIVENIFVHGFKNMRKGCRIGIDSLFRQGNLSVRIANNGNQMSEERVAELNALLRLPAQTFMCEHPDKVGIYNVNTRIKLTFGDAYGLQYANEGDMTAAYVSLPIQINANLINCNSDSLEGERE